MKKLNATTATVILSLLISTLFAQELPMNLGDNNAFWFDTESLDLTDGDEVFNWNDDSDSGNDAYQNSHQYCPEYSEDEDNTINNNAVVYFEGGNKMLNINNSSDINTNQMDEKSMMIFFRTSDQINNMQVIYEEGGRTRGMNLYIDGKELYAGFWNLARDNGDNASFIPFTSLSVDIEKNTDYMVAVVMDAVNDEFRMYLNGMLVGTEHGVGTLYSHSGNIGIGGVAGYTVTHDGEVRNKNFKGSIGEFLLFDSALTDEEVDALEDYLGPKWGFDHTGVLPVEMLEYSAQLENNSTTITWATATELNNDFFTIERSNDLENWTVIGTVYGAGNSNYRNDYEFVDYTAVNGTVYYRISQTDFDGTTEVFNPFSVNANNEMNGLEIVSTYNNGNQMRVEFTSESSEPVNITIFSMSGVVLAETTVIPNPGFNSVNLNVNASGIGIMKLGQRGEFLSEKTLLN